MTDNPSLPLIVDGHEDIAWNVLTFERDYTKSAVHIRRTERDTEIPSHNGHTLLGKADWLLGRVAVIFSTLFATPIRHKLGAWDRISYETPQEAYDIASRQLDLYHQLADENEQFHLIGTQADLDEVLASWEHEIHHRKIGFVPLMEGADPIIEPAQVEEWAARGIRIIGPAWKATRYVGGTGEPGPFTADGFALLDAMSAYNLILDISHLSPEACKQALARYDGTLIASHSNPQRFLPSDRGLSDGMIADLAQRGGVVGIVPYNRFLDPGWRRNDPKEDVSITLVADAIDHVCQVTGSVEHVAIGSDFDGGLGWEHVPAEIETVADLQLLAAPLRERGYDDDHITQIFSGNWLRILRTTLS